MLMNVSAIILVISIIIPAICGLGNSAFWRVIR